jgi:hypothetical protein
MPKYAVLYTGSASHTVEVEADTPEQARELSWDLVDTNLCHHCASKVDLGDFEDDERDEPEVIG